MIRFVCQDTFYKCLENLPGNYNTKYYDLNNVLTSNIITVREACVKAVPNIWSSGWQSVLLIGRFGFWIPAQAGNADNFRGFLNVHRKISVLRLKYAVNTFIHSTFLQFWATENVIK
jgi:hypothetical protein